MRGEELESQAGARGLESPEQELDQVRIKGASRTGVGTPRGMLGSWGTCVSWKRATTEVILPVRGVGLTSPEERVQRAQNPHPAGASVRQVFSSPPP